MSRLPLANIAFDAGTQIRASIDQQVVSEYADAMTAGAMFPPIVVFHDGTQHYLADGFHRFMAAQRNQFRDIDADVRPGTKDDALWFALGANGRHGKRLGERDVSHAVEIAIRTWPERSGKQIAEQVGCSQSRVSAIKDRMRATASPTDTLPDRVIGKDGKSYPASVAKEPKGENPKKKAVVDMVRAGKASKDICAELGVRAEMVADVRRELGVAKADRSRNAVRERLDRMRVMAEQGHTSRQIAAEVGLSEEGCRGTLKREGISVPADKATRNSHRHDSNRILEQIVTDAENLTEGVNLIDFAELHRDRLADWLRSLEESRSKLGGLIRRLMKEQQHGKVA